MAPKPELVAERGNFVGCEMQHEWSLHGTLNDIILPNSHVETIIEIGTGYGALTLVLGLFGLKISAKVFTIDINPEISNDALPLFEHLKITRLIANEHIDETHEIMRSWFGNKPTYLLCDGQNKDHELRLWSHQLPEKSIISVHDWPDAVKPHRVPESLTPYRPEDWEKARLATWTV